MIRFELGTSGRGSNSSAICATTTFVCLKSFNLVFKKIIES